MSESLPHANPYQPIGEPPLDKPYYGIPFGGAVKRFFTKYATFAGRASRSEYWWATLAVTLVFVVLYGLMLGLGIGTMDPITGEPGAGMLVPGLLMLLFSLGIIIPSIAVTVRRLHDANFSGWFYLLNLIPFGSIAVLVFTLMPSRPEGARFDADGGAGAFGQAPYGRQYGQA